jgi:hypothetical protein
VDKPCVLHEDMSVKGDAPIYHLSNRQPYTDRHTGLDAQLKRSIRPHVGGAGDLPSASGVVADLRRELLG